METTYILVDFENVQPNDFDVLRGPQVQVKVFHGPHQNKFDVSLVKALQPLGTQVEYIQSDKVGKNALDFHIAFWMGRLLEANRADGKAARFIVVSKDRDYLPLLEHVRSLGYEARQVVTIGVDVTTELGAGSKPTLPRIDRPMMDGGPTLCAGAYGTQPNDALPCGMPASVDGDALTATEPLFPKHSPAKKSKAATKNSAGERKATRTQPDAEVVDKVIKHLRAHSKSRPANRAALERHLPHMVGGSPTMATVHAVVAELERRGVVTAEAEQIRYKIPNAKE